MFKSAYTKLTLWYLAIVMTISIIFSVILYNITSTQLLEEIKRETARIHAHFPIIYSEPVLHPHQDLLSGDHVIIIRLIIFNLIVLAAAGFASYFLARITLKPIELSHQQEKLFTSNVSHELRTPLTALKMESEIALLDPKKNIDTLSSTISSNLEEIDKIENLINNILKLSKLESSESQVDFNLADSEKIITAAVKQLNPIIKNRGNKINFTASKKKLLIYVNQESIIQLMTIILDNANKYSPKNSTIDINHYIENHQIVIEVKDHGEGMDKETLKHIFDKFYRADNSRNKTTEGYGIGLSIAKMIADINQANIVISSQIHDGTTVKIYFKQLKDKLVKTT